MSKTLRFNASKADAELIKKIATRFCIISSLEGLKVELLPVQMDITAVHCNGNPLLLRELLSSTREKFVHDIFGIAKHFDRETGQFTDGFTPGFSAQKAKVITGEDNPGLFENGGELCR